MERVKLCGDGKYRWIYKMSTLKNPTMMIRMGKILGVTLLVIYIIAQLASLIGEGEKPFLQTVEMLVPAIFIILAVYIVSYLLWVLLCGEPMSAPLKWTMPASSMPRGKIRQKNKNSSSR